MGTAGGRPAPKKLCIFFPLFSHRRDETASDIDLARVTCYKLATSTLDIFSILVALLKFFIEFIFNIEQRFGNFEK